jgi:hypothetical protein
MGHDWFNISYEKISTRNENHLAAELPSNVTLLAYSPRLETSKTPGPRKEVDVTTIAKITGYLLFDSSCG